MRDCSSCLKVNTGAVRSMVNCDGLGRSREIMADKIVNHWPRIIGALTGVLLLIFLRVEYYEALELKPNMGPQIAYFFSPFLLLFVLGIGFLVEKVFNFFDRPLVSRIEECLGGACHSSVLSIWAFPKHQYIFLVFNPIVLRFAMGMVSGLTKDRSTDRPTK